MWLYTYWGDAAGVRSWPLKPADRELAAEGYVRALARLAEFDIPAAIPHLPDTPPRPTSPQEQRRHEEHQKLRQRAELIRELIVERDIFLRQLKNLYDPSRFGAGDREAELAAFRRLAQQHLGERGDDDDLVRIVDPGEADNKRAP
jgi:hypothetical protein